MLLIYLPVLLVVLYYALYNYFTRTFNYWKKISVVGPEPVAFFGNLKEVTLRTKNMGIAFHEYYNMYPEEKVVGIYRMTTPCLLVRDLDIIKHIMIKDFDLFKDRGIELSNKGLGQNLFHTDGDTWSGLRSTFNPLFTPGKIRNMYHLLTNSADKFDKFLESTSRINPEYEVYSLVRKYTLSAIFTCAFGIDLDTFYSDQAEALKAIDKLVVTPNYAIELDMMYPGLLKKLDLSIFPVAIRDFFDNLVANIVKQRNGKPSTRGDFMDLVLSLRESKENNSDMIQASGGKFKEITDDLIAAQAFVFYIAGFETSASTMSYMLYELARHAEIQDKAVEEIDTVMKAHNGEITYEAIKDLKYLEKIFSETLRMYSLVEPLQRKARVDYKVPDTDLVIKKNMIVLVSVRGIHYDEKYYPNPEVFDPERFAPDLVATRHSCAYMPFGVGPRYCIGMRFGKLQTILGIATILAKFRVKMNANTKMQLGIEPNKIIIAPKEQIYLNIVPRQN